MHDEDIYRNKTSIESEESEESETRETGLMHCINHIEDLLVPTDLSASNRVEKMLLRKYGFEDIQKVVKRKYEEIIEEILRQIDEHLKSLTPEQQSEMTGRNLKGWLSKISEASTLAQEDDF